MNYFIISTPVHTGFPNPDPEEQFLIASSTTPKEKDVRTEFEISEDFDVIIQPITLKGKDPFGAIFSRVCAWIHEQERTELPTSTISILKIERHNAVQETVTEVKRVITDTVDELNS